MGVIVFGAPNTGNHSMKYILCALGMRRVSGLLLSRMINPWVLTDDVVWSTRSQRKHRKYEPYDRALSKLEDDQFITGHVTPFESNHDAIVLFREPKDAFISWYRKKRKWRLIPGKRERSFLELLMHDFKKYHRCVEYMNLLKEFHGYGGKAFVVHYETMHEKSNIEGVAKFIGKPMNNRSLETYGTGAFSGHPVDWRDWFTERSLSDFEDIWAE